MNRVDLERYLRDQGCELLRHGAKHDIWINPSNLRTAPVPRHRYIKKGTIRAICRQLLIPPPPNL